MRTCKFFVSFLALILVSNVVFAGEIDILVQKLVDKGILSAGEAQTILTETKEEVKKQLVKGEFSSVPEWVQNIKFKGDARLRYQWESRDGSNTSMLGNDIHTTDRQRARLRLRLGAEAKVNNKVKAFFGIASGSDADPRSTNQTFQDMFSKKSVWIDYAYVDYAAQPWLTLRGGRMKNPIWEPGDLLWDTDINPEGGAIMLSKNIDSKLGVYLNSGYLVMDEYSNTNEPSMYFFQPGLKYKINDTVDANLAVSYYGFQDVQNRVLDWSANTNTRKVAGANDGIAGLAYDYDVISPSMEISINEPLKMFSRVGLNLDVPYMAVFGEYIKNTQAYQSNAGYMVGLKFGHKKVENWKQWQLKYNYAMLGTNSWLDVFPDSDRYSGGTGIRGHEAVFSLGLAKNLTFDLDYYNINRNVTDHNTDHILQADLNFKF